MGLASRVGEMGTFWHFLGWASFGFLWEPRGIPSNPFSLGHFALHLISAASGAHGKQGPQAIGVGLLDNSSPEKEPVGACGLQSQQEHMAQSRALPLPNTSLCC